jgi:XTP/dITP diphosphohydrolase
MPNNIPPVTAADPSSAFLRLLNILDTLRAECPWDKKQTMETLRHLTIEETYELSDAILDGDLEEVKKELGDVMMHLVLNSVCDKLINRHPHIYGDVEVQDENDVKRNWEQIKLKEGNKSVLGGVPASLPALVKAGRIQEKARGIGFDWDNKTQVWEKVEEELEEFKKEYNVVDNEAIDVDKAESEFGDLIFSLVNYARFIGINPENALEKTNKKFIKRFQYIESKAQESGKALQDMTLAEMDVYWNEAKTLK